MQGRKASKYTEWLFANHPNWEGTNKVSERAGDCAIASGLSPVILQTARTDGRSGKKRRNDEIGFMFDLRFVPKISGDDARDVRWTSVLSWDMC